MPSISPFLWFNSQAGEAASFYASIFPSAKVLSVNPMMAEFFRLTVFGDLGDRLGDRTRMIEFFNAWNQAVIDEVPAEKLLVYAPGDGWEPLCAFLGVPVPVEPYPRVNSREEMTERTGQLDDHGRGGPPAGPEALEAMVRGYLTELRAKAFPTAV